MPDAEAEAQGQEDDGHGGQDEVDLGVALVDVFPASCDLEGKNIFTYLILGIDNKSWPCSVQFVENEQ